jgi:hypothetical protein
MVITNDGPKLLFAKTKYLFDKKKVKLFFSIFFSTRTKEKVKKRNSFFIGHEVLFYETTFSASALEH